MSQQLHCLNRLKCYNVSGSTHYSSLQTCNKSVQHFLSYVTSTSWLTDPECAIHNEEHILTVLVCPLSSHNWPVLHPLESASTTTGVTIIITFPGGVTSTKWLLVIHCQAHVQSPLFIGKHSLITKVVQSEVNVANKQWWTVLPSLQPIVLSLFSVFLDTHYSSTLLVDCICEPQSRKPWVRTGGSQNISAFCL